MTDYSRFNVHQFHREHAARATDPRRSGALKTGPAQARVAMTPPLGYQGAPGHRSTPHTLPGEVTPERNGRADE